MLNIFTLLPKMLPNSKFQKIKMKIVDFDIIIDFTSCLFIFLSGHSLIVGALSQKGIT